jgi:predicted nucleic acid-binding protein
LKGFLVDSSYLFALYRDEGERSNSATETFASICSESGNVLFIPWPVLYESLNSEFSSPKTDWVERLNSDWSKLRRLKRLELVDDSPFRQADLDEWFGFAEGKTGRFRGLSLVDRILMALVEDRSKNIAALLTFDLRDFSGFCAKRGVEIIPGVQ